jgi:hypothetical protein
MNAMPKALKPVFIAAVGIVTAYVAYDYAQSFVEVEEAKPSRYYEVTTSFSTAPSTDKIAFAMAGTGDNAALEAVLRIVARNLEKPCADKVPAAPLTQPDLTCN